MEELRTTFARWGLKGKATITFRGWGWNGNKALWGLGQPLVAGAGGGGGGPPPVLVLDLHPCLRAWVGPPSAGMSSSEGLPQCPQRGSGSSGASVPLPVSGHHLSADRGGRPTRPCVSVEDRAFRAKLPVSELADRAESPLLPARPRSCPCLGPRSRAVLTGFLGGPLHLLLQVLQALAGHSFGESVESSRAAGATLDPAQSGAAKCQLRFLRRPRAGLPRVGERTRGGSRHTGSGEWPGPAPESAGQGAHPGPRRAEDGPPWERGRRNQGPRRG